MQLVCSAKSLIQKLREDGYQNLLKGVILFLWTWHWYSWFQFYLCCMSWSFSTSKRSCHYGT